jgi:hypothetical protein
VNDAQRLELLRSLKRDAMATKQGFQEWDENHVGTHWRDWLRKMERLEKDLLPDPLPALGPVRRGGKSLLAYQLTHNTDGIALYPAFDDNWGLGTISIAPEPLVVVSPYTSANPGAAFYAKGSSGIHYWIGHLTKSPRVGTRFTKGQEIGRSVAQAGAEHTHWGINVEAIIGAGKQLGYGRTGKGPDYTYGAPAIGVQLRQFLEG